MSSVRFNSPSYLDAWKQRGEWPVIHNPMADFAAAQMRGQSLLDLGCAFGLLGARISKEAGGIPCVGVERDPVTITAATEAGVPIKFAAMKVTRETLTELIAVIATHKVDTIIARRILPELWGEDLEGGKAFASVIAATGVREVFLEGRIESERATNPLRSVNEEVALLSGPYREVSRMSALRYLVVR